MYRESCILSHLSIITYLHINRNSNQATEISELLIFPIYYMKNIRVMMKVEYNKNIVYMIQYFRIMTEVNPGGKCYKVLFKL